MRSLFAPSRWELDKALISLIVTTKATWTSGGVGAAYECIRFLGRNGLGVVRQSRPDLEAITRLTHAASVGDASWDDVVDALARFVGAGKGALYHSEHGTSYRSVATSNFDPTVFRKYDQGFNARDPRTAISMRLGAGEVGTGQGFLPNHEIERTEYFQEITLPANVMDSVHGVILDDRVFGRKAISLQRGFGEDIFGHEETRRLSAALPKLSDAMRYSLWTSAPASGEHSLSLLLDAAMTVRILRGNAELLRTPRLALGLERRAHATVLALRSDPARRAVRTLWRRAFSGHACPLRVTQPSGPRLDFTLMPMPDALAWVWDGRPCVLLSVSRLDGDARVDVEAFAEAHALTPAERHVLAVLCDGGSSADVADRLGIKPETLRWHVKNLMSKTGFSRRDALVRAARVTDLSELFASPD